MKADSQAYQDQKQVQKLGNQRGDGSTGNAHSGGTQLSEDEQIVQPGVRRYRAKTCPKGDSGVFLAAQPCGQDGADRHGQIRERHDAEVLRPHTEDGSPCPERRILMNGGQSGNAFPACQCIIKANDLHILRDADALSLQKSHKFQRIVLGHRKYRRDFFRKKAGKVLTVKRHSLPCRSRDLPE